MDALIRVATEADARGVAEVVVLSWQNVYKGIISAEGLGSLSIAEREACWRERLGGRDPDAADWINIVCEKGGKIVGFATYRPCGDEDKDSRSVGELVAIYLLPDYWGQGLGKLMLDEVLRHFKAQPVSEVTLWVIEGNHRARRFYEIAGFRADGLKKTEVKLGSSVALIRYAKAIAI